MGQVASHGFVMRCAAGEQVVEPKFCLKTLVAPRFGRVARSGMGRAQPEKGLGGGLEDAPSHVSKIGAHLKSKHRAAKPRRDPLEGVDKGRAWGRGWAGKLACGQMAHHGGWGTGEARELDGVEGLQKVSPKIKIGCGESSA